MKFDLSKRPINPIKSGIAHFNELTIFYLYFSPCSSSSLTLNFSPSENILKKILSNGELEFLERCNKNSFSKRNLDKTIIEYTKGLLIKRKRENSIECLLRHLRNCFAHARIYKRRFHGEDYFLFKDKDDDISAVFVLSLSQLFKLKDSLLEEFDNGK